MMLTRARCREGGVVDRPSDPQGTCLTRHRMPTDGMRYSRLSTMHLLPDSMVDTRKNAQIGHASIRMMIASIEKIARGDVEPFPPARPFPPRERVFRAPRGYTWL
jgi:hypothetical protein